MRRPAPGARERAQHEPAVARPRRERHVRDGARGRVRVGRRLDDLRGALRVFSQTSDGRTRGARRGADARARRLAAKARDDAKRLQRRGAQRLRRVLAGAARRLVVFAPSYGCQLVARREASGKRTARFGPDRCSQLSQ